MADLHPSFPRIVAPGGRTAVQLTSGPGFAYPLYYYIPSITADGRTLIHHVAVDGTVQLHRLDLRTGASEQLTHATHPETWWRPWCWDAGAGVRDHQSILAVQREEVIWTEGTTIRARSLAGGAPRDLLELPADRIPIGQGCVSGDGRWLVHIHADRERFLSIFEDDPDYPTYWSRRERCRDTRLDALDLETGEQRTLVVIASPIHHVLPVGERQLVFCHPTSEMAMLLTGLDGGWYTHLRTQGLDGGQVCHYLGTERGLMYEVLDGRERPRAGIIDPASRRAFELPLPEDVGYVHTGRDPSGRRWLFEDDGPLGHVVRFLESHDDVAGDTWRLLTSDWPAFGDTDGQKAHHHPQVVLDGRWLLITAGDPATRTNQLFLLDIADLPATAGIPDVRARRA